MRTVVVGACLLVLVIPAWAQTEYTWMERGRVKKVTLVDSIAVSESIQVAQSTSGTAEVEEEPPKVDPFMNHLQMIQSKGEPVFRDSTGELMYLPGGVLVKLIPLANKNLLMSLGIEADRITTLSGPSNFWGGGGEGGWYRIETEPGFPSLELANSLISHGFVIESIPRWERRDVVLK